MDSIKQIKPQDVDLSAFDACLADCLILNAQGKLLLQKRPDNWRSYAGCVNLFGGHVDAGETPLQGMMREIEEETGATINVNEAVFIGAITEDITGHKEVVYIYFWEDKDNRVTGCYEAEAIEFLNMDEAVSHPKIMDYAVWALRECAKRELIK